MSDQAKLVKTKIPTREEVLAEVRIICKSERFARVTRHKKNLLRYLVRLTLRDPNRKPLIKGMAIAIDVFGKIGANFDSKKDTIVKVAMGDLRTYLSQYYAIEGSNDRVKIEIPVGSYVPEFKLNPVVTALDLDNQTLMMVSQALAEIDQRIPWMDGLAGMYLDVALKSYPNHPRLLALSAMFHAATAGSGMCGSSRKRLEEAEALIARARAENSEPWECTLTDAWVNAALYWNWEKAARLFERANALSSGVAVACQSWYASFLASQLQFDDAVAVTQDALTHSYDRTILLADLALFQIIAGKLDEADATVRLIMQRIEVEKSEPVDFLPIAYRHVAFLSAARGDFEKASAILDKAPKDKFGYSMTFALQSLFLGLAGQRTKARERYEELKKGFFAGPFQFAMAASGAGDDDEAVFWLKAAAEMRDPFMILAAVLPITRHLRSHAGFRSLITDTMKLPFPPER
jgi:tetratricopeptide (TPR) repeat protein